MRWRHEVARRVQAGIGVAVGSLKPREGGVVIVSHNVCYVSLKCAVQCFLALFYPLTNLFFLVLPGLPTPLTLPNSNPVRPDTRLLYIWFNPHGSNRDGIR